MPLSDRLGPYHLGFDTTSAFAFYESIRHRLPTCEFKSPCRHVNGLLDVAGETDVFVFDAFGVLNIGESPIPGAVETLGTLRKLGKQVFVVTNAASMSMEQAVVKFQRLGFDFTIEEIITSRMAAENALQDINVKHWGVIANNGFDPKQLSVSAERIEMTGHDNVDGFLFLSTQNWHGEAQLALEQALDDQPRPLVIANPDVVAPREQEFSTEPGYCGHRIADLLNLNVIFHGKPFPSVFELVRSKLPENMASHRICMVGDTLHTDVLGGAYLGWSTVLITDHGLFRGHDAKQFIDKSGIVPTWIAPSI